MKNREKALRKLAEKLVEEWHHEEMRSGNPFGSGEQAALSKCLSDLGTLLLCGGKFKIRHEMSGSPIMLSRIGEITFADLSFAWAVRDVLIAKEYAEGLEVMQKAERP